MFISASLILAFTMGLVLLAFTPWRRYASNRAWMIGGGVIFPTVSLSALLIFALAIQDRILLRHHPDVVLIIAHARQWAWTFGYSDAANVVTTNVLYIPTGLPIEIRVTSEDVIHSFWIPRLGGKVDAIPGHTTVIRLLASSPGVFLGQCAEFCGIGHARMPFAAEAFSPHDYRARLQALAEAEE